MDSTLMNKVPKKRDYIAQRCLDDVLFMVNPDDLRVHRLAGSGRAMWDLIDGRSTGDELAQTYCRSIGKPYSPKLRTVIASFFDNLRDQDLIYTDDEPGRRRPMACAQTGEAKDLSEPLEVSAGDDNADVLREMWQRAASKKLLLKTDLELTYACNHDCLHCYNPKERRKVLTTEQFLELIDTLADQGCLFLGLTGGEVFVRPDTIRLARRARERTMSVRFLSNGSLIDEELADQIAEIHPESVEITLLGVRPETHDSFAQAPGSFERILRALKLLADREVNVFARYIFTRHNVYEAPELPKLAANLGVKHYFPKPHLFPTVEQDLSPTDHRVTDEQLQWLVKMGIVDVGHQSPCFAGVSRCSISPWGEIHPCEFLPHVVGNIQDQGGIRQTWLASEKRLEWEDPHIYSPTSCQGCSKQSQCVRCPAMAFLDEGSLTSSSSQACRITGLIRGTRAEMAQPAWQPPAYDASWAQDLPFLQSDFRPDEGLSVASARVVKLPILKS